MESYLGELERKKEEREREKKEGAVLLVASTFLPTCFMATWSSQTNKERERKGKNEGWGLYSGEVIGWDNDIPPMGQKQCGEWGAQVIAQRRGGGVCGRSVVLFSALVCHCMCVCVHACARRPSWEGELGGSSQKQEVPD